jgi:glycosyltransferase involved in cell wall biosynthesis
MDGKKNRKVAAIVAAYDEAGNIHHVLHALTAYPGFDEIIVVDDGSSDGTAAVAVSFPVRLIRHEKNRGKGQAMTTGVEASDADILFFCDADMHGIDDNMLDGILRPVLDGESEMVIAMRNWRMYYAESVLSLIPILGGQRALTRRLWEKVPHEYKERFMIETALNFYARYWGNGFLYRVTPGLKQIIKERKYGFWKGFKARIRMSGEVVFAQVRLQFREVPQTLRAGRAALRNIIAASAGSLLGALILIASYRGPVVFVREMFAKELRQDPDAPFVHLLLYMGSNIGADFLAFIGVTIMALNMLAIVLSLQNLRYLAYRPAPAQRVG